MIKIYSAADLFDAQIVCDALLDAGMKARVQGGFLTGAAGELPVDSLVSVWLESSLHEQRARQVIKAIEESRQAASDTVVCSHCAETTTSHFAYCWSCGGLL